MSPDEEGAVPQHKSADKWNAEIKAALGREERWRELGDKVVARYLDDRKHYTSGEGCERRVNILYSNVETLRGNLFSQLGKPDVRRKYPKPGNANKVARTAAIVLERNLDCASDRYRPEDEIEDAITDRLTVGRGQCRVEYNPKFKTTGEGDDAKEELDDQIVEIIQLGWKDWTHGAAKKWRTVPWVAFKDLQTGDECWTNFPKFRDESTEKTMIPLNHELEEGENNKQNATPETKRAVIWEIWDLKTRSRIYVAEGFPHILEEHPDPYGLENFFPCPEPIYGVKFTERLIPVPDYLQYKDQAEELDRVNTRIWHLIEALKFRGVRLGDLDGGDSLGDIDRLEDGQFLPLKNFQQLVTGGGLSQAFQAMDLAPIAVAIQGLAQRALELVQSIYEITGISDVIRGSTDPNETLGAQNLKAQFGSQRIQKEQKKVQRFVAELYKIKGEIIAEHFERDRLSEASGVPLPTEQEREQARALLKAVEAHKKQQEMMAQQQAQMQQQGQGQPPMGAAA